MSGYHAALLARTPDGDAGAVAYLRQVFGVCAAEVQKLRHDPFELATRAVQPVLWLVLFGEVMAQVRGLSTGGTLSRLPFCRGPDSERAVRGDLLRHCRDLGARSRHPAPLPW